MSDPSRITLWHVPLSHFSEKARWALDHKRVPHTRRAVLGGMHPLTTWVLTRGEHQTVPVLTVDGIGIGDSTAIIGELEARLPDRPLYPADPQALAELTDKQVPWVRPQTMRITAPNVALFLDLRFGVRSAERAKEAEEKLLAALDRLEEELSDRGEFLAGDAFSVADLTAASLFYGLVLPPEGPWRPTYLPPPWRERMEALADRPGVRWVADTYARHRLPAAKAQPVGAAA